MEEEIQEELEKIYKHLKIEVKYIEPRTYEIEIYFERIDIFYKFQYIVDSFLTLKGNIEKIENIIDYSIIKYLKGMK